MRRLLPFAPALAIAVVLVSAIVVPTSRAQTPPPGGAPNGPLEFNITTGKKELVKIAVPRPTGDVESANLVGDVVSGDLYSSSWFKVLDPRSFIANLAAEGLGINVPDWRNVGAEAVAKERIVTYEGVSQMECKLYVVAKGNNPVLEKVYKGSQAEMRRFAHAWSSDIVRYYSPNEDTFFTTQIAMSVNAPGNAKEIAVMDYDGFGFHKLTSNGSQNILPAWSPSGGQIAYTSFVKGNPDLYLISTGGGRGKRIANYPGVNMGAAFSPDGNSIALTLSQDGQPDIYLIGTDGRIRRRLTDSPFIDSSPAWSPDGAQIAFVSNRHGSPQIWTMSASGANQQRVTRRGNYNQEPNWCPKNCAAPTIAFTARDEKGVFDLFTVETTTGNMARLTENQGSSEHPSYAPNGRAITFESSKGGIWVMTLDGKLPPRQVYRGGAATPAWGPRR